MSQPKECWRNADIAVLDAPERDLERLEEGGIFTLGELEDCRQAGLFGSIKGFNVAAMLRVAYALEAYWESVAQRRDDLEAKDGRAATPPGAALFGE